MKAKFIVVILQIFLIPIYAQVNDIEEEIEIVDSETHSTKVEFEIDIDLNKFKKNGNNYWEKESKGFVHVGVRQVSYEDMKTHMGKNDGGLIKIIEEKEILLEGILFLYAKQEQIRAEQIVEMMSFAKKHKKNSIIEIGVIYPKGEEEKYRIIVEKTAISAKVIEK